MKILNIMIILLFTAGICAAQVGVNPAAFNVDFASFKSDSAGYNMFEVYYLIYSSNLLHVREGGRYMAKYTVNAIIKDGGRQVAADEREDVSYAASYNEAENPHSYIVNLMKFYLKPGKYKVQVTLNDLNASSSIPLETNLEIPDYPTDEMTISQIEFARQVEKSSDKTVFDKNGWRIIPSCSRRFGDGIYWLKYYYEIYNNDNFDKQSLVINFEIRDRKNNVIKTGSSEKNNAEPYAFVDSLNLENLKPGRYDLIIYTQNKDGDIINRSGNFSITWSSLELVKNDFESAVEQLRYIASTKEMDQLKNAPKDDRIKEWNEFWKSKDPSPDTDENEIENEYYRRISYTNRHFDLPQREGWRSDMGMIYIINGAPDDIEKHPFDIETKPYEIWYYYNPRRRFLFIDENGYGEYVLQYPYDGDVNKAINIYGGGP
jgi:GWxTD domain-containing protein